MSDVQAVEQDAPPQENEAAVKARRLGWLPKEEFKGDVEHWRSAEDFLERGERLLPLLQRDNDKLHRRLTELEGTLRETREASKELLDFTSKSEERAYKKALAELQAKAEQAAANADPAMVRATLSEIEDLNKSHVKPEAKPQNGVKIDPDIQSWIERESWFNKDRSLNAYATDTYGDLERNKPGMSTAEKLAETKRLTMEKFPEKFGINPSRSAPAAVGSPTGAVATRKKGHTYEDLPAEAKKACDKFVKTIPGYKREDYLKDYEWDD